MKKWDYECFIFKKIRELLKEENLTTDLCFQIMNVLEACCDELTPNNRSDWVWYDAFRDMKAEIHEEIECMSEDDYESCEQIVNNYLSEFYGLCDEARVWLCL